MRYILDTHIVLWWYQQPDLLKDDILSLLRDKSNIVFVSAVVLWEIVIKEHNKKLKVTPKFYEYVKQDFEKLPLLWKHAEEIKSLKSIHKDPFDRILIAQARVEDLTLITRDSNILKYTGVKLLKA